MINAFLITFEKRFIHVYAVAQYKRHTYMKKTTAGACLYRSFRCSFYLTRSLSLSLILIDTKRKPICQSNHLNDNINFIKTNTRSLNIKWKRQHLNKRAIYCGNKFTDRVQLQLVYRPWRANTHTHNAEYAAAAAATVLCVVWDKSEHTKMEEIERGMTSARERNTKLIRTSIVIFVICRVLNVCCCWLCFFLLSLYVFHISSSVLPFFSCIVRCWCAFQCCDRARLRFSTLYQFKSFAQHTKILRRCEWIGRNVCRFIILFCFDFFSVSMREFIACL